jgi:AcrR family transcriptional regulator
MSRRQEKIVKARDATAPRGRPRGFDPNAALTAALKVFWHKGFDSASLADLTDAMAINRASMYSVFGNKEELFRQALDLAHE